MANNDDLPPVEVLTSPSYSDSGLCSEMKRLMRQEQPDPQNIQAFKEVS